MQDKGQILVKYFLGDEKRRIGIMKKIVNDGEYHMVKMWRKGPNITLEVDEKKMMSNPSGWLVQKYF